MDQKSDLTSTHWGVYHVDVEDGAVTRLRPFEHDPDPSPIGDSLAGTLRHPARITQPMVRKGWLDRGPRVGEAGRGAEPFVAVDWDRALDLVAGELTRTRQQHGNEAIMASSYGWASAGRFHHAQSQLHRFMNLFGGYVSHVNSYSLGAGAVILPHVVGSVGGKNLRVYTEWPVVAEHTRLFVSFGGIPLKNTQVDNGGSGRHQTRHWLQRCRDQGVRFISFSPLRADTAEFLDAEWYAPRPGTDVAVMLGMAHTLLTEDLHDRAFLDRWCVGFDRVRGYLLGQDDGQPKDAAWAGAISELPAEVIRDVARRMAAQRTLLNISWSLQRADHGEQPFWMLVTLAAMLGQIGLPGGGFGIGYGAVDSIGAPAAGLAGPTLPRGTNPVATYFPVARIADMLLAPGTPYRYDGHDLTYPDIRLIYWAGGNPFHHHQDLNRLLMAWRRPETIVVHEPYWNALARHADIVLPATTSLERNDLGWATSDRFLIAMRQAVAPAGTARSDYAILSDLADRLGFAPAFTEGRDESAWLRHLYDQTRTGALASGIELPAFDDFWERGYVEAAVETQPIIAYQDFRRAPESAPLTTPSGRIELFSTTIDGFGEADCIGHAAWYEPAEWLGSPLADRFPLHLISNQPATRLHSQLDHGSYSQAGKVAGREPILIHPDDAAARGIRDGDVVRVSNDRGACLAGAVITAAIRPRVVQLATGAWYDPAEPGVVGSLDKHGNPNVLTLDKGSSALGQGSIAQTALVEVAPFRAAPPPITAFTPPPILESGQGAGGP